VAGRQKPRSVHPSLAISGSVSRRSGNSKLSSDARKKKVPGTRGIAKQHPHPASTFIMSALNVTPFGNRPARRARFSGISRHPPHPSLPHGAFAIHWRFRGVESFSRGSLPLVGFSISSAISLGRFVVHHSLE